MAEALDRSLAWYGRALNEQLEVDLPVHEWIASFARRVHQIHIDAGPGLWHLAAADDQDLAPEIALVNKRQRVSRRRWTVEAADRAC